MNQGRRRLIIWGGLAAGFAVLCFFVRPFRIVPLDKVVPPQKFDAVTFVASFWKDKLIPAAERAVPAAELTAAVEKDPEAARKKYGRSLGMSSSYCYFVRGTGRVVSLERNLVVVAASDSQPQLHVGLKTGKIFGNAVRDGTGLLNVNDFANSQDFSALSGALNDRIEREVLPALQKQGVLGATVQFAGCAEIKDEENDLHPLRVVPFLVTFGGKSHDEP
jgi:predicted lipoprotein